MYKHPPSNKSTTHNTVLLRRSITNTNSQFTPIILIAILIIAAVLKKAAVTLNMMTKANPSYLKARVFLGYIYYKLGQYVDAKQVFNQVLILDPQNKIAKDHIAIINLYNKTN